MQFKSWYEWNSLAYLWLVIKNYIVFDQNTTSTVDLQVPTSASLEENACQQDLFLMLYREKNKYKITLLNRIQLNATNSSRSLDCSGSVHQKEPIGKWQRRCWVWSMAAVLIVPTLPFQLAFLKRPVPCLRPEGQAWVVLIETLASGHLIHFKVIKT